MLQTAGSLTVGSRIEGIVCGIDFTLESDRACAAAGVLARYFGARLLLIHVVENRGALARARERLGAYLPTWLDGLRVDSVVTLGDPPHEIARLARREGAGLVVIGAHNHAEPLVPDGFEAAVAESASCPVLMLRGPEEARALVERLSGLRSDRVSCTVCARPVEGLICPSCRARISFEAMEHKWHQELREGPGISGLAGARALGPVAIAPGVAATDPVAAVGERPTLPGSAEPRRPRRWQLMFWRRSAR
jgi:nucleotide-binding universal stress UspA family protein